MKTPKDFQDFPYSSVEQKTESEVVASNIMTILRKTGNKFRKLSYREYKKVRLEDGNYSDIEEMYFKRVVGYCTSAKKAMSFSPAWNK